MNHILHFSLIFLILKHMCQTTKYEYSRFFSLSGMCLLIFLPLFFLANFNISSMLLKCFFCFFCPSRSGRCLSSSLDELELESLCCFLRLSRTLFLRLWSSSLELLDKLELEESDLEELLESSRFFLSLWRSWQYG